MTTPTAVLETAPVPMEALSFDPLPWSTMAVDQPRDTVELLRLFEGVITSTLVTFHLYSAYRVVPYTSGASNVKSRFDEFGSAQLGFARRMVSRTRQIASMVKLQWQFEQLTGAPDRRDEVAAAGLELDKLRWSWRTTFQHAMTPITSLESEEALQAHVKSIRQQHLSMVGYLDTVIAEASRLNAQPPDIRLLDDLRYAHTVQLNTWSEAAL